MDINIITRCTRPYNLIKIKESLLNNKKINIIWWIIFDTSVLKDIDVELLSMLNSDDFKINLRFLKSTPGACGYDLINQILKEIDPNEWMYLLDDDNILHPNFSEVIGDIKTDKSVITFSQFVDKKDFTGLEYRISIPENMRFQGIDSAQILIKRSMVKEFALNYAADGILIDALYKSNPEEFLFIDKVISYYNFIPSPKSSSLPRVLLLGLDEKVDLKSIVPADYESKDLLTLQLKEDDNLDEIVSTFNPDSIMTIGESFDKFPNLCNLSLDIRRRWSHFDKVSDTTGESAYLVASNYILNPYQTNNPLISFFTPFFNTGEKLWRTYESVKNQSYTNWEWVLVNDSNDCGKTLKIAEEIAKIDCRVKVYDFREKSGGIVGESKYRAASLAKGLYLMELDHDDYITPDAAYWMVEAFQKYPEAKFVYSDCVEIYENHEMAFVYGEGFSFGYGSYRDEVYNGRSYKVMNTANINPKTIRHIVGVPNHFRAWDRFFYHSIGGHNRRLTIADDYELIVRTFLKTKMVRIPKLLYLQFYHNNNTQNATRADIQRRVRTISSHYNHQIYQRFKELGVVDWAYESNPENPLYVESRFGNQENYVNLTFGESGDQYQYNQNNKTTLNYLF